MFNSSSSLLGRIEYLDMIWTKPTFAVRFLALTKFGQKNPAKMLTFEKALNDFFLSLAEAVAQLLK